jgi:hypothetical protein
MYIGLQKIVAISGFGIIKRGDKTREHCIWEKNPLKLANLYKGHLQVFPSVPFIDRFDCTYKGILNITRPICYVL